jgi:RND superfamily putative drug exporter
MAALGQIRQEVGKLLPQGMTVQLVGATAEMADIRAVTQRDFYRVAALSLSAVFAIVVVLLRDLLLAAFMVASTVLSYLATLGATSWFFTACLGVTGLDWKVEVFLFVVMVAVGQDYNIFLAARLAEESLTADVRTAARLAVVRTGGVISSAGVIMAATLGSLAAGDLLLLVELGFAFALGMLVDTFLVRPLLLPTFAVLTGRTGRALTGRKSAG